MSPVAIWPPGFLSFLEPSVRPVLLSQIAGACIFVLKLAI